MYKILDRDANEHVTFETYEDACIFKGINPKSAYKVKRNTKDRPKSFSNIMQHYASINNVQAYCKEYLTINHLKVA